ncbi:MAG: hypothetical protein RL463_1184 [Bacteroidota bacterium]|jgi:hypothetical protein
MSKKILILESSKYSHAILVGSKSENLSFFGIFVSF